MDIEKLKQRLECVNIEILVYKNNLLKEVENEQIIPATNDLLVMRDLKEQQLLLKSLINEAGSDEGFDNMFKETSKSFEKLFGEKL